jgi:hypothetical protein
VSSIRCGSIPGANSLQLFGNFTKMSQSTGAFQWAAGHGLRSYSPLEVSLVWFAGAEAHARKLYEKRGGLSLDGFQKQITEIEKAGFPNGLNARVVEALTPRGSVRPMRDLWRAIPGRLIRGCSGLAPLCCARR